MGVSIDRTDVTDIGSQLLTVFSVLFILFGGIVWTGSAPVYALTGIKGFFGVVAGYALLGLIGVNTLTNWKNNPSELWSGVQVEDTPTEGDNVAVSGSLVTPVTTTSLSGDRVVGFEYHILLNDNSLTTSRNVTTGWEGPGLQLDTGGESVEIDPATTDIHVDCDGSAILFGVERTESGRINYTDHHTPMQVVAWPLALLGGGDSDPLGQRTDRKRIASFIDESVGDDAFTEYSEGAFGNLNQTFRLRYWDLPASETVYVIGDFERERPGGPFRVTSNEVVVGTGAAADRKQNVLGQRQFYRRVLFGLSGLFVLGLAVQFVPGL